MTAVLVWAVVAGPWLLGQRTPIQRDVFLIHLHYKAYGASQLAEGRIPAINTSWGLGQPFRGNPSALPFYPGNVAYVLLPFWSAFGGHYALHWLLAGVAMFLLARRLGRSRPGALLASLVYAWGIVAALSFYNILAVLAWWPLVLTAVLGRGKTAAFLGGLALGMAILAGEPVTLVVLAPSLLLAALHGRTLPGALARCTSIAAVGTLVGAPQIVATLRILPFTSRGGPGIDADAAAGFALQPARWLEVFLPFPFGIPFQPGPWGYWTAPGGGELPYFVSLYAGALVLPLVLIGARRQKTLTAAGGGGLALAWLGAFVTWLTPLSGGLFRHPEKFLLWAALATPLVVAAGFDHTRQRPGWTRRMLGGLALAAGLALAWIGLRFDTFVAWQRSRLSPRAPDGAEHAQALLWVGGLLLLVIALVAAYRLLRARRPDWLPAVHLITVLPLVALLPSDDTAAYGPAQLQDALGPRHRIWSPLHGNLSGAVYGMQRYFDDTAAHSSRWAALDLEPGPGILNGLAYPVADDLEGLASPLLEPITRRLAVLAPEQQVRWLRAVGVEAVVTTASRPLPLPVLAVAPRPGEPVVLYGVPETLADVSWPASFEPAASVGDAFRRVAESYDPVARPVLLTPDDQVDKASGQGRARRVVVSTWTPDRIEIDVDTDGGVLVVRRAFLPLYRARLVAADGSRSDLPTLLANAFLLAVRVPAGRHRVEISAESPLEWLAALVAVLTAVACVARVGLSCRPQRSSRNGETPDSAEHALGS